MADKKVTITISPMLAGVLQRMIEEETNKQKLWSYDDHAPVRKCIIEELNALSNDLQAQGYAKFFRCYQKGGNMTVGAKLKEIRKLRNLTQAEAAKGYGCTRQYIIMVENDQINLGIRGLRKFAKFYGIPVETLTTLKLGKE